LKYDKNAIYKLHLNCKIKKKWNSKK